MVIKTGKEKRLNDTYKKVRKRYEEIRSKNQSLSDNAIHTIIAQELNYTPAGIRRILKSTTE